MDPSPILSRLEENNEVRSVTQHETADLTGQKQILLFLNLADAFNGDLHKLIPKYPDKSLRSSFLRLTHAGDLLPAADSSRLEFSKKTCEIWTPILKIIFWTPPLNENFN